MAHPVIEALRPIVANVLVRKIMEKLAKYRTSTKTAAGATVGSQLYLAAVELVPNEAFVAAFTTPEMVAFVTVSIAWTVARISKTPANPGAL